MTPLIRSPVRKHVELQGDLYQLVALTATARLVSFNEQINYILNNFFFGDTTMSTKNNSRNSNVSGFTLIELLIVVAIIGIVSAIGIPVFLSQRANARDKAAIANMTNNIDTVATSLSAATAAGTGSTAIAAEVQATLPTVVNPWNQLANAFNSAISAPVSVTVPLTSDPVASLNAVVAAITPAASAAPVLGQVVYTWCVPTGATYNNGLLNTAAVPGILIGQTMTQGANVVTKVVTWE